MIGLTAPPYAFNKPPTPQWACSPPLTEATSREGRLKKAKGLMWSGVLVVAVGFPMAFHAVPHAVAAAHVCSLVNANPYLRSAHETYVIGSARTDTVQVRISDVPGAHSTKRYPYRDSTPVFGQVVQVQSVYGADADHVLANFSAGDSRVVVILYGMNSMCVTFPVRPRLPTGSVDHYTLLLRPDSEWADGRPTFDMMGLYPPYLNANFESTLTVDEYASLVKVIPVDTDWVRDCGHELTRLENWVRSNEASATKYPADEIMRTMRWHCSVIRRKN